MSYVPHFMPLNFIRLPADEQHRRAVAFYNLMRTRRTVRQFSAEPVPFEIIRLAIQTAVTAPSGANLQP